MEGWGRVGGKRKCSKSRNVSSPNMPLEQVSICNNIVFKTMLNSMFSSIKIYAKKEKISTLCFDTIIAGDVYKHLSAR